jgi:hypothetical protein
MARSAASIQAEITVIEGLLSSEQGNYSSVGADGVSRSIDRAELASRLDRLYQQLGRANGTSPMFARTYVKGLR